MYYGMWLFCVLVFLSIQTVIGQPDGTLNVADYDSLNATLAVDSTSDCSLFVTASIFVHTPIDVMCRTSIVTCQGLGVKLTCPATLSTLGLNTSSEESSCFRVVVPNVSLSIVGCTMLRSAIVMDSSVGGRLRISGGSVLDGMKTHLPVNVYSAEEVVLQDVVIVNGNNLRTWMGGGCVSLKGIRGLRGAVIDNVTVRNCSSMRAGGCVCVIGDASTEFIENPDRETFPPSRYGSIVSIRNSVMESGTSTCSGLLSIIMMNHVVIESNIFRYGVAKAVNDGRNGGIELWMLGSGSLLFTNNVVSDCISGAKYGCLSIVASEHGEYYRTRDNLGRIEIIGNTIRNCHAGQENGCMFLNPGYHNTTISSTLLSGCHSFNSSGCLEVFRKNGPSNGSTSLSLSDVRMTDCTTRDVSAHSGLYIHSFNEVTAVNVSVQSPTNAFTLAGIGDVNHLKFNNIYLSCPSQNNSMGVSHVGGSASNIHYVKDKSPKYFRQLVNFIRSKPADFVTFYLPTVTRTLSHVVAVNATSAPKRRVNVATIPSSNTLDSVLIGASFSVGVLAAVQSSQPGSTVYSSTWLGVIIYECNRYVPSEVDKWIASKLEVNIDDVDNTTTTYLHPRVVNVYLNVGILLSVAAIETLATIIIMWVTGRQKTDDNVSALYTTTTHPGYSLRAYIILLVEITAGSITSIVVIGGDPSFGAVGLTMIAVVATWVFAVYFRRVNALGKGWYRTIPKKVANQFCGGDAPDWMISGGEWFDTASSEGTVAKAGALFTDYTAETATTAGVLNIVVSITQGVLSGVPVQLDDIRCGVMYCVTLAMYVGVMAVHVFMGPMHHTRREHYGNLAVLVLLVVGNVVRVVDHTSSVQSKELVYVCVMMGLAINVTRIILQFIEIYFLRKEETREIQQEHHVFNSPHEIECTLLATKEQQEQQRQSTTVVTKERRSSLL